MPIDQIIRERYPISYDLPAVNGISLALSIDEDLTEALKRRITLSLARFPLSIDDHAMLRARVCMTQLPGTEDTCLALLCGERRFYFVDGDTCESLAWTLYSLAQEIPSLNIAVSMKLRAVVFSAEQQSLASSLLSNIRYWESEIPAQTLEECLEGALAPLVEAQCARIPLIGRRPVTEDGWSLIGRSKSLFAKKTVCTLGNLAAMLYGPADYFEEMNAFVRSLVRDEEFQREMSRTRAALLSRLYALPLTNVDDCLHKVIDARKSALRQAALQARQRVALCLKHKLTVRRIEPENVFSQADAEFTALARIQLEGSILAVLENGLQEELARVLPAAQRGVSSWRRDLRDFCRIDLLEPRQRIGWDYFNRPDVRQLHCQHGDWDAQRLYALQLNAGTFGRYNREIWFCAPRVHNLCSDDFKPITRPVEHLPASLMVVLMSEYL